MLWHSERKNIRNCPFLAPKLDFGQAVTVDVIIDWDLPFIPAQLRRGASFPIEFHVFLETSGFLGSVENDTFGPLAFTIIPLLPQKSIVTVKSSRGYI